MADYSGEPEPPKRSLSYKNGVKLVSEKPLGKADTWTFYYNYEHNGINVKLGDCVFIAHATEEEVAKAMVVHKKRGIVPKATLPYAYALRVQYIIKDEEGNVYISGYYLYTSDEIKREQEKEELEEREVKLNMSLRTFNAKIKAYPNFYASVVDSHVWAPIHTVTDQFAVLYEREYNSGQLTMFKPSLVYPLVFNYSYIKKEISLVRMGTDIYHRACQSPLVFKPFDVKPLKALTCPKRALPLALTDVGENTKKRKVGSKKKVVP